MAKFAAGKYALGISDRSGFAYKLNDMRLEWTGSLVGPEEWEKKQTPLDPRKHITDPQALKDRQILPVRQGNFYRLAFVLP